MLWQRIESRTDVAALLAAVAVIPMIAVELTVAASGHQLAVSVVNWLLWSIFAADAVAKLGLHGRSWLRTRSAWLALVILGVSFPPLGPAASAVRLARLGRLAPLARMGRLGRLGRLLVGAGRSLHGFDRWLSAAALPFVTVATAAVVTVGAAALYVVEFEPAGNLRIGDSLWWALTTVTTVGYGDIVPSSAAGRIVGAAVMLLGIAYTSLLTAQIAAYLGRRDRDEAQKDDRDRIGELAHEVRLLRGAVERLLADGTTEPTAQDGPPRLEE